MIDALDAYYRSQQAMPSEDMLRQIVTARQRKRQRLIGAVSAFAFSATCALLLLSWAARPAPKGNNAVAGAIARYQMINSGLVERTAHDVRLSP
jgi:hypothetical protein